MTENHPELECAEKAAENYIRQSEFAYSGTEYDAFVDGYLARADAATEGMPDPLKSNLVVTWDRGGW